MACSIVLPCTSQGIPPSIFMVWTPRRPIARELTKLLQHVEAPCGLGNRISTAVMLNPAEFRWYEVPEDFPREDTVSDAPIESANDVVSRVCGYRPASAVINAGFACDIEGNRPIGVLLHMFRGQDGVMPPHFRIVSELMPESNLEMFAPLTTLAIAEIEAAEPGGDPQVSSDTVIRQPSSWPNYPMGLPGFKSGN